MSMSSFEIFAGIVAILLVSLGAFGVLKPALAIGSVVMIPVLIGGIMLGTALILYNLIRPKPKKEEEKPKPPPFQDPFFQQPQQQQPQPVRETPVVTQQPVVTPQPIPVTPVFNPIQQNVQQNIQTQLPQQQQQQQPQVIIQPVNQEEFMNWMAQNNPDMFQQMPQDMTVPDMVMPVPQKKPTKPAPSTTPVTVTTPNTTPPVSSTPSTSLPSSPTPTSPTPSSPSTVQSTGSSYTPEQATDILNAHNSRRSRFNVPNLTWDPTIAAFAQSWAEKMAQSDNMSHSGNSKYGENVYYSMSSRGAPLSTGEKLLTSWFDEEWKDYDYNTNTCNPGKVCGHATQVVWKDSTLLGCGRAVNNNSKSEYVSCNFFKPGNWNGQKPF